MITILETQHKWPEKKSWLTRLIIKIKWLFTPKPKMWTLEVKPSKRISSGPKPCCEITLPGGPQECCLKEVRLK